MGYGWEIGVLTPDYLRTRLLGSQTQIAIAKIRASEIIQYGKYGAIETPFGEYIKQSGLSVAAIGYLGLLTAFGFDGVIWMPGDNFPVGYVPNATEANRAKQIVQEMLVKAGGHLI